MCCPGRCCCLCILLIAAVIAIGLVFGFGVFAHGFDKIKHAVHEGDAVVTGLKHAVQQSDEAFTGLGRPMLGAPPPC